METLQDGDDEDPLQLFLTSTQPPFASLLLLLLTEDVPIGGLGLPDFVITVVINMPLIDEGNQLILGVESHAFLQFFG